MTDQVGGKERRAAADAARFDAQFGMQVMPDDRTDSAERMAYDAYQRGDQLFQIDLPISYTQGNTQTQLSAVTRTVHVAQGDVLGAIERQGWRLEHVSTAYIAQGTVGAGNYQAGHHGVLTGVYVFRRGEAVA